MIDVMAPFEHKDKLTGKEVIKDFLKNMPECPGVYRMLDAENKVLYVGKAKNLKKRVVSYTKSDLPTRLLRMVFLTHSMEIITTNTEAEALLLEASLIKKLQPRFNILLRDDKSYPYIKLRTDHDFPQVVKYRGKKTSDGKLFGPFASSKDVDKTINELQKVFKLRPCSDNYFMGRKRPCLQYQIKRCSGACVGKVSKDYYANTVKQIEAFLTGKTKTLQEDLNKEMQGYSDSMDYEKAAEVRDKIKALSYIQSKAVPAEFQIQDADVIAVFTDNDEACVQVFVYRGGQSYGNKAFFPIHAEGNSPEEILSSFIGQYYQSRPCPAEVIISHEIEEKEAIETALTSLRGFKVKILTPKKGTKTKLIELALDNAKRALTARIDKIVGKLELLEKIRELFQLNKTPERIEVYDNSHIFGRFAVGAMIVATSEGFDKNEYRRFTIDNERRSGPITGGDDYAMLSEVLSRRFKRIKEGSSKAADLMIIDGGKGHLSTTKKVMEQFKMDIPFVCMSKGVDRNAGREVFHLPNREPFTLPKDEPIMKYLQILRDEAHNFAIKSHRIKRSKAISLSALDAIPGVGPKRKRALLEYFGSVDAIKEASIADIMKIEKINKTTAETIHNALHSKNY
ncbi:MAG: uvrC [Rickettsiaceae bacterium]|jgi:excinuclease ABC subunit C|nr:uvrC [Rickettsiaceae bacterium]